jgi:hypothetical protein
LSPWRDAVANVCGLRRATCETALSETAQAGARHRHTGRDTAVTRA